MTHTLRPYQQENYTDCNHALATYRRIINCIATGGGKTKIAISIIMAALAKGKTVLLLTESDKIYRQLNAEIANTVNINSTAKLLYLQPCKLYLAMAQTLARRPLLINQFNMMGNTLLIINDEAHIGTATKLLLQLPKAYLIGLTATPHMKWAKHLPLLYNGIVVGKQPEWLVESGYLTRYQHDQVIPAGINQLEIRHGEYTEESQEKVFDTANAHSFVIPYLHKYPHRKAMIFCASIKSAESLAAYLTGENVPVAVQHSKDDVRSAATQSYELGKFHDLNSNVNICISVASMNKGYDFPPVDLIMLYRATTSLPLYLQMCLDEQTEILTINGFKKHYDVCNGDVVASYDLKTKGIIYSPCKNKVNRPLTENEIMYSLQSPYTDIRITDQHNLCTRSRVRGKERPFLLNTAEFVSNIKSSYEIPISGYVKRKGIDLSDSEIRFLGWFLSDGTLNKKTKSIVIYQSESQPKYIHDSIINCMSDCGFKIRKYICKRKGVLKEYSSMVLYSVSFGNPRATEKHLSGYGSSNVLKYLDKNISDGLFEMNEEQIALFLETFNLGDGVKRKNIDYNPKGYTITAGSNKKMADRLQHLLIINGYKCNITEHNYNKQPLYNLYIKKTDFTGVRGVSNETGVNRLSSEEFKNEMVWCVQTDLGTLVTRRNGKVTIMGNCGRGSRLSPETGKQIWTVVDYGGNGKRHGRWDYTHDWANLWNKIPKKREGVAPVKECPKCFFLLQPSVMECPNCGHVFKKQEPDRIENVKSVMLEKQAQVIRELKGRSLSSLTPIELAQWGNAAGKKTHAIRVAKAMAQTDPLFLARFSKAMGYKSGWADFQAMNLPDEKIDFYDKII